MENINYGAIIAQQLLDDTFSFVGLDRASEECLAFLASYLKGTVRMKDVLEKIPVEQPRKKERGETRHLLVFLHKTARKHEVSKKVGMLQFVALLKRIAMYLSGNISLSEV